VFGDDRTACGRVFLGNVGRVAELAKRHGISVATVVRLAVKRLLDEGVKLSVPQRRD
jgi:hypothetical protein